MKHRQLSLFRNNKLPKKQRPKRKYNISHWSYRQRLIHLVSQSKSISWKQIYLMAKQGYKPAIKYVPVPVRVLKIAKESRKNKPIKRGHVFKRTVNQKRLAKAVHAMYLRKHGKYKLSINKICKKFKISKPSLYRGYNKK